MYTWYVGIIEALATFLFLYACRMPSEKVASSSLPSSKQNSNDVTSVKVINIYVSILYAKWYSFFILNRNLTIGWLCLLLYLWDLQLPEKPTKIVNDHLDSLKLASDLQPINEEYHENPSLKIASNEKWKEQLEESQLKSNDSSHEVCLNIR